MDMKVVETSHVAGVPFVGAVRDLPGWATVRGVPDVFAPPQQQPTR